MGKNEFNYRGHEVELLFSSYDTNGNTAILLIERDTRDEVAVVTTNTGTSASKEIVAIKDYAEGDGMVKFLQENKIIKKEPIHEEPSGYIVIPFYELTEFAREIQQEQER